MTDLPPSSSQPSVSVPAVTAASPAPSGPTGGSRAPTRALPWGQLARVAEFTVVSAVAGFLSSLPSVPGGSWDSKHLIAAAIAAATGAGWKLSGILQQMYPGA